MCFPTDALPWSLCQDFWNTAKINFFFLMNSDSHRPVKNESHLYEFSCSRTKYVACYWSQKGLHSLCTISLLLLIPLFNIPSQSIANDALRVVWNWSSTNCFSRRTLGFVAWSGDKLWRTISTIIHVSSWTSEKIETVNLTKYSVVNWNKVYYL